MNIDTNATTPADAARILQDRSLLLDRTIAQIEADVAYVAVEVGYSASDGFEYIESLTRAAEDLATWVRAMRASAMDGVQPSQVDWASVHWATNATHALAGFAAAAKDAVNPN